MIKFSITIPAYKGNYLHEAIESILKQSYQNYELVIVDDCSPEDLKSIVDNFSDSRIRYYRNDKNCGAVDVVDNWNICLNYCTGDYVICMGDDDKLLPYCLEEYEKLINQYPGLGVYHAWTEIIDEDSRFSNYQHPRPEYETTMSLIWNRWNGRDRQYIGDFCFDARKLRDDGGFYKLPMAWGSDDISAVRAAYPNGIANTQIPCFQYRVSTRTISKTGSNKVKINAILMQKKSYDDFLKKVENNNLNIIDEKFCILLKKEFDNHFRIMIKDCAIKDMHISLKSISYYYRNRRIFSLSTKDLMNLLRCMVF